jgi:hypothetical protein
VLVPDDLRDGREGERVEHSSMIRLDAHANMRSHGTSTVETGCGARGSARSRGSALRDGARGGSPARTRPADQPGVRREVPAADRQREPTGVRRMGAPLADAVGAGVRGGDDRAGRRDRSVARGPS